MENTTQETETEKVEELNNTETTSTEEKTEEVDYKAEAEKWRGFARKWEARAKSSEQAAEKLKALEESEAKLKEKLSAIETQRKHDELTQLIAKETGVPAALLRGSTEKELRNHAEAIKEFSKPRTDSIRLNDEPDGLKVDDTRAFVRKLFSND